MATRSYHPTRIASWLECRGADPAAATTAGREIAAVWNDHLFTTRHVREPLARCVAHSPGLTESPDALLQLLAREQSVHLHDIDWAASTR